MPLNRQYRTDAVAWQQRYAAVDDSLTLITTSMHVAKKAVPTAAVKNATALLEGFTVNEATTSAQDYTQTVRRGSGTFNLVRSNREFQAELSREVVSVGTPSLSMHTYHVMLSGATPLISVAATPSKTRLHKRTASQWLPDRAQRT